MGNALLSNFSWNVSVYHSYQVEEDSATENGAPVSETVESSRMAGVFVGE